jgi:hypothetical protein
MFIDCVRHTLGCGEVDDVAVRLEHVDLLDLSDGLDVHLLEGSLELLVVGARRPVDLLLHTSGSSLAAVNSSISFHSCRSVDFSISVQLANPSIPNARAPHPTCHPEFLYGQTSSFNIDGLRVSGFQALHSLIWCVTGLADIRLTLRHGQHGSSINFASFLGARAQRASTHQYGRHSACGPASRCP